MSITMSRLSSGGYMSQRDRRARRIRIMKSKRTCTKAVVASLQPSAILVADIGLSKDEVRRQRNRLSAENSRLKKLQVEDELRQQVAELQAEVKYLRTLAQHSPRSVHYSENCFTGFKPAVL